MNLSRLEEIKNKEYRHGLVNAQIEIDLPLQIRALRKQLVGTQAEMAKLTGMRQPRLSAMEKPNGANFNLETLRRLAEAFDVALIVRFAPFSELLDWSGRFNPDDFQVPSFSEELHSEEVLERSQSGIQYGASTTGPQIVPPKKSAKSPRTRALIVELNQVLNQLVAKLEEGDSINQPSIRPQLVPSENTETLNPKNAKPGSRKWTRLGQPQQQLRQAI